VRRTLGSSISSLISRLRHDEGQTLVEYALILVLVAVVVISALTALDQALGDLFQRVVDDF
jgi:pilus assembly protein Flp/PilA